jgi:hypothetical protein
MPAVTNLPTDPNNPANVPAPIDQTSNDSPKIPSTSESTNPQSDERFNTLEKRFIESDSARQREMAEIQRTNARILAALEQQNAPKPEPINYPQTTEWLKDPARNIDEVITRRINEGLAKAVAPLNEHFAADAAQRQYDSIKAQMRSQFGDRFISVEGEVDNIIRAGVPRGVAPQPEAVAGAFRMALGDALIKGNVPTSRQEAPRVTPVNHIPTSPAPDGRPRPVAVEMTETERFLFNRRKATDPTLTEEEWSKLQNSGAGRDGVSSSVKIGSL